MNDTPSPRRPQSRAPRLLPRRPLEYDSRVHGRSDDLDPESHDTHGHEFPPPRPTDLPADIVLGRLRALRRQVTGSGPSWQAICPGHADTKASLSLTETADGVLLIHCWGRCATEAVLAQLGLGLGALYPSLYALQFSQRRPRGSLHFRGGDHTEQVQEPEDEDCAEWERMLARWPIRSSALRRLANRLDLPRDSLLAIDVGYDPEEICWVLPERDDRRRIVGLVRRYANGDKRAVSGSTRGLTIPDYGGQLPSGPVYLVEGATDAAAMHFVGALAVGRSSATGSATERHWLTRLLRRYADRQVIVVGDRDANGVGAACAETLAGRLSDATGRAVSWALPASGFKDVREQIVLEKWHKGLVAQEAKK